MKPHTLVIIGLIFLLIASSWPVGPLFEEHPLIFPCQIFIVFTFVIAYTHCHRILPAIRVLYQKQKKIVFQKMEETSLEENQVHSPMLWTPEDLKKMIAQVSTNITAIQTEQNLLLAFLSHMLEDLSAIEMKRHFVLTVLPKILPAFDAGQFSSKMAGLPRVFETFVAVKREQALMLPDLAETLETLSGINPGQGLVSTERLKVGGFFSDVDAKLEWWTVKLADDTKSVGDAFQEFQSLETAVTEAFAAILTVLKEQNFSDSKLLEFVLASGGNQSPAVGKGECSGQLSHEKVRAHILRWVYTLLK